MVPYLSRKIFGIVALVVLTVFSLFTSEVNLGLDLQGGSRIVYKIDIPQAIEDDLIDSREDPLEVLRDIAEVFRRRLEATGGAVQDIPIYTQGEDRIVVEMPGLTEERAAEVKNTIIQQGSLQFRIVVNDQDDLGLTEEISKYKTWQGLNENGTSDQFNRVPEADGGPRAGINWFDLSDKAKEEGYGIDPEIDALPLRMENVLRPTDDPVDSWEFLGSELDFVGPSLDQAGFNAVFFEFAEHRKSAFYQFTEENEGRAMAIVLNGKISTAPGINEPLRGEGIITGGRNGFTPEEMRELITVLRTGSLRVKPELDSEAYVGPTLGEDSIQLGTISGIAGALLVLVFMAVYYRMNGIVACMALLFNGFILFGALTFTQATLTLPGLAGLVLTIGMAVDANILIFERIREEHKRGRETPQAYKNGFDRAFSTIIDANLTTLITGLILFNVGTGPIKGFAAVLCLGILSSVFSALVFSKVILHFLVFNKPAKIKEVSMMASLAGDAKFEFLAKRQIAAAASVILIVVGLSFFAMRAGDLLGIDFSGGGVARVQLAQEMDIADVRKLLPEGYAVAEVQVSNSEVEGSDVPIQSAFLVKGKLSDEMRQAMEGEVGGDAVFFEQDLRNRLGDRLHPDAPFHELSTVSERVSGDMQQKAIQAILLSLIAIIIYMNFRFKEFRYGIAAVVAVFHDVLFTLGMLAVFEMIGVVKIQINLEIIAAFLTIIGYSLNDTIVVFDRIRENLPRRKGTFANIIDLSINQSLSRTILTSATTFLVVFILFIANRSAHNVLEGFSFAMLIGVVVGTYSSMWVASPMLLFLDRWARDRKVDAPESESGSAKASGPSRGSSKAKPATT